MNMAKVTIKQGTLLGNECKTDNGTDYYEFLQIPYAKPPVGDLRFQVPHPPEPWDGVRDATNVDRKHVCYQEDMNEKSTNLIGSEDCLYLNVLTPKLKSSDTELLPVIFNIHGGGFVGGEGTLKSFERRDCLLDYGVVVVSINYRLSVFGFLSLNIPEAAGNMGLKDQVMALQWVQDNISKFGGDKDNVTLIGVSAGSASAEYHMYSPLSKGLFHRAILISGSALNTWALNKDVLDNAVKLAQELGYQGSLNDRHAIRNFLLEQSTEKLYDAYNNKLPNLLTTPTKPFYFAFGPCIEENFKGVNAFLTDSPYNILRKGIINRVDVLTGMSEFEGIIITTMKPNITSDLSEKKNFTEFWPRPLEKCNVTDINARFDKLYFKDQTNLDERKLSAIDYFGDLDFVSGIWISAKMMVKRGMSPYVFLFCYDGNLNVSKKMYSSRSRSGADHGDIQSYLTKFALLDGVQASEADTLLRKRLLKMFTDFMKTGNPTPSTSELIPFQWPTFTIEEQKYLRIDKDLEVNDKYKPEVIKIFERIYHAYFPTEMVFC